MAMEESSSTADIQLNRSLIVGGGVLVALGGLLGFTGMALLSSALISATRRWVNRLDEPPSEMARRRWAQTKRAASAGAAAWRDGPPSG
jgi:membrane protein implicated in regulation of membrane protease activity